MHTAQLVGTQYGEVVVSLYDWATFLGEHFRKVLQMKSYHHFMCTVSSKPGFVTIKKFSQFESISFEIHSDMTWAPTPYQLPPPILLLGLSSTRQWYLYNQIRDFVMRVHKTYYALSHEFIWSRSECKNHSVWHMMKTYRSH